MANKEAAMNLGMCTFSIGSYRFQSSLLKHPLHQFVESDDELQLRD